MKIRQGFVANSSSSSFLIHFANGMPDTQKKLKPILFDKLDVYEGVSTQKATKYLINIFNNRKNKKFLSKKDVEHFFEHHYEYGPSYNSYNFENAKSIKRFDNDRKAWAKNEANKFLLDKKLKNLIVVCIEDNDTIGSIFEQFGLLEEKFGAIRASNH